MKTFDEMAAEIFETNERNGWYEGDRTFGDDIALLHSEISEALEAFRIWGFRRMVRIKDDPVTVTGQPNLDTKGLDWSHVSPNDDGYDATVKPEGVGSEMADIFIRLLDTCWRHGIDLQKEYDQKMAHNRVRGYRHGGKAL